jgi:hypothetical protein
MPREVSLKVSKVKNASKSRTSHNSRRPGKHRTHNAALPCVFLSDDRESLVPKLDPGISSCPIQGRSLAAEPRLDDLFASSRSGPDADSEFMVVKSCHVDHRVYVR